MHYRHGHATYRIRVVQDPAQEEACLLLDGIAQTIGAIALEDDERMHEVELRMAGSRS
jgi:hypothetical protein